MIGAYIEEGKSLMTAVECVETARIESLACTYSRVNTFPQYTMSHLPSFGAILRPSCPSTMTAPVSRERDAMMDFLQFSINVIPSSSMYSCAIRDTVWSTMTMSGFRLAILATRFLRKPCGMVLYCIV